jgi:ornithine cyclodeaminase/alanine dehydrogenase-like protein (mu-crystallin family)
MTFDDADWTRVIELKNLVAHPEAAQARGKRPVIFKSVGIGLEDVAVAGWVFENEHRRKAGTSGPDYS